MLVLGRDSSSTNDKHDALDTFSGLVVVQSLHRLLACEPSCITSVGSATTKHVVCLLFARQLFPLHRRGTWSAMYERAYETVAL